MSYLIGLYVYYHGNNLSAFGITKGARDEDLNNKGYKALEEIDRNLVDNRLLNDIKAREDKEKKAMKELNWEAILRDQMMKSQKKTYDMQKRGLIQDTIFDNTPDTVLETYDSDGSIPLSFFSEINGIK